MAAIFDEAFASMGLKKEKGVQKIVDQFVSSLEAPPEPSLTTDAPVSEGEDMILEREDDEESLMGVLAQAELELKGQTFPTEEEIFEAGKRLSVKLTGVSVHSQARTERLRRPFGRRVPVQARYFPKRVN